MFRRIARLLKSDTIHTLPRRAVAEDMAAVSPSSSTGPGRWRLNRPVVLDGLDAPLPVSVAAAAASSSSTSSSSSSASTTAASADAPLTAQHLWAFSRVLRTSRDARRTHGACVVGGASAIRRVWRQYGLQPTVVYVPETEPVVPAWCLEDALPSVVVRCAPVQVKRALLSAEYSDGYAAEFPCAPETRLPPVHALLATDTPQDHAHDVSAPGASKVSSMVVLVGLRIPSNVGLLIRAAVDLGFERVVLVNCTDPFHEKVLRASDGTVLSPHVTLHELYTGDGADGAACVSLLSAIAAQHHLLPLLAVPSQDAEPAFHVAHAFHRFNRQRAASASSTPPVAEANRASPPPWGQAFPLGPMVVLGSESQGLRALDGRWTVPYQLLSLPVPNSMVDSFNVGVAGSILLNLFRPGAAAHFTKLRDAAGEVDDKTGEDQAQDTLAARAAELDLEGRGTTPPSAPFQ